MTSYQSSIRILQQLLQIQILMVNLERHWIAIYFVSPQESEFFDSYGFPPESYGMDGYVLRETTYYKVKPMQGLTSDVCGDHCLFYLLHRARNVDLNTIQNKFLI